MTPVPLELPLRPSEAAELAGLIFESAERKPLTDEVRNRIAARAAGMRFETIRPFFGSLDRDPVHHSTYYLAVDVEQGDSYLLHMALATAPTSSIFQKPLLVGRMRGRLGPEIVINAIPFGPGDSDAIEKFATRIDTAFLPRPQGSRAAIVAGMQSGASDYAGVFDAFRAVWKRTGRNLAGIGAAPGAPASEIYYGLLRAAIRNGWRDGFTAVARLTAPLDAAKEAAREAIRFSTFCFDAGALVRGGDFTEALAACERIRDHIRQTRSAMKINRPFEFEVSFEGLPGIQPGEVAGFLQELKERGHAAQIVALHLAGRSEAEIGEFVAVLRQFQCGLDVSGADETASRAMSGRLTCSLAGPDTGGDAVTRAAESLFG